MARLAYRNHHRKGRGTNEVCGERGVVEGTLVGRIRFLFVRKRGKGNGLGKVEGAIERAFNPS